MSNIKSEELAQECSKREVLLKILQRSLEKKCVQEPFLNRVAGWIHKAKLLRSRSTRLKYFSVRFANIWEHQQFCRTSANSCSYKVLFINCHFVIISYHSHLRAIVKQLTICLWQWGSFITDTIFKRKCEISKIAILKLSKLVKHRQLLNIHKLPYREKCSWHICYWKMKYLVVFFYPSIFKFRLVFRLVFHSYIYFFLFIFFDVWDYSIPKRYYGWLGVEFLLRRKQLWVDFYSL